MCMSALVVVVNGQTLAAKLTKKKYMGSFL